MLEAQVITLLLYLQTSIPLCSRACVRMRVCPCHAHVSTWLVPVHMWLRLTCARALWSILCACRCVASCPCKRGLLECWVFCLRELLVLSFFDHALESESAPTPKTD